MAKVIDKVAWVMDEDKVLKLTTAGVKDIAENVVEFLKKTNVYDKLVDKTVEVEIDDAQGQDGTITHLKVVEDKKEEPKKEEKPKEESKKEDIAKPANNLYTKEIVVGGVAVPQKGVISKDEVWYTLDGTIDAQKFKDECTKKTIEITVAPQEKGNDVIKSYVLKAEEEPKDVAKTEPPKQNNNVQKSIEAQASVNSANEVVAQMKDILNDPKKVLSTISKIAEHNFDMIQKLKNKE